MASYSISLLMFGMVKYMSAEAYRIQCWHMVTGASLTHNVIMSYTRKCYRSALNALKLFSKYLS